MSQEESTIKTPRKHPHAFAISDLPNELLIHILTSFPTLSLLHFRLISHHFRNVIIRIVHQRLLLAASLQDRMLILECYHPSAQFTEPYLFCDYLGTPGLSSDNEGQGTLYQHLDVERGRLKHLYSRFRPTRADVGTKFVQPHPAGDVPGSRTNPIDQASSSNTEERQLDLVTHNVLLEPHELFTQLSITAALVQTGPRRGVFLSFIDVVDKRTPRVFRDWLAERSREMMNDGHPASSEETGEIDEQSGSIIWADEGKTMGLKVRVKERKWRGKAPVLVHRDEEPAISYSLELEGTLTDFTIMGW
ncbi:MAG: hypothetical protein Q9224_002296 [Gallowayella concinna]